MAEQDLRVLRILDGEVDARTPAPPLRVASRRLGRQLLRVGSRCWPSALLALAADAAHDPHQSVAFGLVALAAGLDVEPVGHLVAHHAVTTPMQTGVRLLGLDPFGAAAATAALAGAAAAVVTAPPPTRPGPLRRSRRPAPPSSTLPPWPIPPPTATSSPRERGNPLITGVALVLRHTGRA